MRPAKKIKVEINLKWRQRLAVFLFGLAGIITVVALGLLITIPLRTQLAEGYVKKARQHIVSQNFSQAQADLIKAKMLSPSFGDVYLQLGYLYEAVENWEKAVENFDKAFSLNQPKAAFKAGEILWRKKRDLRAKDYLLKAENAENLLGEIAIIEEEYEKARRYFTVSRDRGTAEFYLGVLTATYNPASAKKHFEKAEASEKREKFLAALDSKTYPLSVYGLLAEIGYAKMALPEAKNYVRLHESERDGWITYAYVLLNLGKYEEAEKAVNKAIEIDPLYVYGYNLLALIYEKTGQGDLEAEAKEKAQLFK